MHESCIVWLLTWIWTSPLSSLTYPDVDSRISSTVAELEAGAEIGGKQWAWPENWMAASRVSGL